MTGRNLATEPTSTALSTYTHGTERNGNNTNHEIWVNRTYSKVWFQVLPTRVDPTASGTKVVRSRTKGYFLLLFVVVVFLRLVGIRINKADWQSSHVRLGLVLSIGSLTRRVYIKSRFLLIDWLIDRSIDRSIDEKNRLAASRPSLNHGGPPSESRSRSLSDAGSREKFLQRRNWKNGNNKDFGKDF